MKHAVDGSILDVGRKTRRIHPALRRALEHRDGCCAFPGCERTLCDAHHIEHWSAGGATKLSNLVLLCRMHHRAVHEGGFGVSLGVNERPIFRRPDGRRLREAPKRAAIDLDLAFPLKRHRSAETEIDPWVKPVCSGERLDLGYALDGLRGQG